MISENDIVDILFNQNTHRTIIDIFNRFAILSKNESIVAINSYMIRCGKKLENFNESDMEIQLIRSMKIILYCYKNYGFEYESNAELYKDENVSKQINELQLTNDFAKSEDLSNIIGNHYKLGLLHVYKHILMKLLSRDK